MPQATLSTCISCLVFVSCCCYKIRLEKQLKGGGAYSDSQFAGVVHLFGVGKSRQQKLETEEHITSITRRQTVMNTRCQSSPRFQPYNPGSRTGNDVTYKGGFSYLN